jgi:hypothetical protein
MGKRTGVLQHEADILKLTLADLDVEIARCEMRRKIAPTVYERRSFEKRIHWLGKIRARHPDISN